MEEGNFLYGKAAWHLEKYERHISNPRRSIHHLNYATEYAHCGRICEKVSETFSRLEKDLNGINVVLVAGRKVFENAHAALEVSNIEGELRAAGLVKGDPYKKQH